MCVQVGSRDWKCHGWNKVIQADAIVLVYGEPSDPNLQVVVDLVKQNGCIQCRTAPMCWDKGNENPGRILKVSCGTNCCCQDQIGVLHVVRELDRQRWGADLDRELERLTWPEFGKGNGRCCSVVRMNAIQRGIVGGCKYEGPWWMPRSQLQFSLRQVDQDQTQDMDICLYMESWKKKHEYGVLTFGSIDSFHIG